MFSGCFNCSNLLGFFFFQEKECASKKGSLAVESPWFILIGNLIHLAVAEKTYSSLSFVAKKRFRKDVSNNIYITCIYLLCDNIIICWAMEHSLYQEGLHTSIPV